MRDMVPRGDRSIRNIPVSAAHRHPPVRLPKPPRPRRRWLRWATLVVALCAAGGVLLSTLFAGATVSIHPRRVTPAHGTLAATLQAQGGALAYQTMSVTRSATTTVPASGTQHVSRLATGVVTIYNARSTSQRLIANTRFEAPDGKMYRIHDSVVVPAQTKTGSATTPGSVTVSVYADSAGSDYNRSGATNFTLPAFRGDPRYSTITARSGPISGGFVGTEPAIPKAELTKAQGALTTALDTSLTLASDSGAPEGFVPIGGTLRVVYGDLIKNGEGSGAATLSQSATATSDIVRGSDLAVALARKTVSNYQGEPVAFDDLSKVALSLATSTKGANGALSIAVQGSLTLVWQFDPDALKQALLGKDKSTFETILQSFAPALSCTSETPCDARLRPFWASTFPTDPNKITIVVGK